MLGAVGSLMTSFGLPVALLFILLAIPLIVRVDHLVALSGLLTGFGALWSLLMVRQVASGGILENAMFWTAVGVVPVALGLTFMALGVIRQARAR